MKAKTRNLLIGTAIAAAVGATGGAIADMGGYGAGCAQMQQGQGGHGMMGGMMKGLGMQSGMMGQGSGSMMGQGMMGSGMMGPGMMGGYSGGYGDCPGAAYFGPDGWNSESHQKFLEDTVGLRKELNDKGFEYAEAQRNPNTNREQLASIEKEIIDIRTKLQEQAEQKFKK